MKVCLVKRVILQYEVQFRHVPNCNQGGCRSEDDVSKIVRPVENRLYDSLCYHTYPAKVLSKYQDRASKRISKLARRFQA